MTAKWLGPIGCCQLCGADLSRFKYFIDGVTRVNGWALMCTGCHARYGVGLGTGRGQKYEVRTRLKVAG